MLIRSPTIMPKRRKDSGDGRNAGGSKSKRHAGNYGGGGGGDVEDDAHVKDEDDLAAAGGSGSSAAKTSNTIPIFLKKTYRMIESCDTEICTWTEDGDMFVVKNPELFASEIIPQYFDHNKFSSFARQLNFYGFRKIQTKPIRNEDFDQSTAKHVTFFNEKFKRGRYDLLKEIQRSTRGGGAQASLADQAREMDTMRSTVASLEQRVADLEARWKDVGSKVEREIQAKVELAVMDLLSSSRSQVGSMNQSAAALQAAQQYMDAAGMQQQLGGPPGSLGADPNSILQRAERSFGSIGRNPQLAAGTWENPLLGPQAARAFSTASAGSATAQQQALAGGGGGNGGGGGGGGATLPPHPKQKNLPPPVLGDNLAHTSAPPHMASSGLRSLSTATNSSLHLRNAWEDKFFSTLMMTDGSSRVASLAGLAANGMAGAAGGMPGAAPGLAALAAAQQQMQNQQQQHAGLLQQMQQQQMQMAANRGGGGGGGGTSSALKRQTTAEILLEAAGELRNGGGSGREGKNSKKKETNEDV